MMKTMTFDEIAPAAPRNIHPNRETCYRILEEYGTPPHVIGHCKAVAAVAYALGKALNERGYQMDLDLILSAGLLHDMARVEERHWDVAADWCETHGLAPEAEIIRVHMTYDPFNDADHLNETDLVCMADRVVLEDRYAGIDKRMEYIVQKAIRQGHEGHVPHILRKKEEARQLIDGIEAKLGCTMDQLMEGLDYEHIEKNEHRQRS